MQERLRERKLGGAADTIRWFEHFDQNLEAHFNGIFGHTRYDGKKL